MIDTLMASYLISLDNFQPLQQRVDLIRVLYSNKPTRLLCLKVNQKRYYEIDSVHHNASENVIHINMDGHHDIQQDDIEHDNTQHNDTEYHIMI
jgi:hypothetical protein